MRDLEIKLENIECTQKSKDLKMLNYELKERD